MSLELTMQIVWKNMFKVLTLLALAGKKSSCCEKKEQQTYKVTQVDACRKVLPGKRKGCNSDSCLNKAIATNLKI